MNADLRGDLITENKEKNIIQIYLSFILQQTTITEVVKNEFLGLRIGNNDPGT